ncbi:hypothetical protein HMPREF0541_02185 [Lacticaseibacillus rhamnosus ATCC 21052]|nr:hypothetical protein HMPREF0541_02185 [Lacticaseibacillus rhamnosus ATCC 21052]
MMAGFWPLRPRPLHAGPCAGERVMGVNQNISGLRRYGRVGHCAQGPYTQISGHCVQGPYTQIPAPVSALWA